MDLLSTNFERQVVAIALFAICNAVKHIRPGPNVALKWFSGDDNGQACWFWKCKYIYIYIYYMFKSAQTMVIPI